MPRFRPEIAALDPYQVGRQLAEVARAHGLDPEEIVKLTANEGPEGPFPGVVEAASQVLGESNRYPDNACWDIGHALAAELGVDFTNILFGAGSVALLTELAIAAGGPGTNLVYGWPSFVMYRFAAIWSGSEYKEIPLDEDRRLDLDAMLSAIDDETSVIYLCNPNNPTGTIRAADEIAAFIEAVPDRVTVAVDEAYHEFVTHPSHRTAIPLALERSNVLVLRTFSKLYALAAHRIGYAIGQADTLAEVRKAQAPLTVNAVAQTAALASLGQHHEVERRRAENEARRHHLVGALAERGIPMAESHTNFIFFDLGRSAHDIVAGMTAQGVLIRGFGGNWARMTIGNEEENRRFLVALDTALAKTT